MVIMLVHFIHGDQFLGFSGSWSSGSSHHTMNCESGSECATPPRVFSSGAKEAERHSGAPKIPSFPSGHVVAPTSTRVKASVVPVREEILVVFSPEDRIWVGVDAMSRECMCLHLMFAGNTKNKNDNIGSLSDRLALALFVRYPVALHIHTLIKGVSGTT